MSLYRSLARLLHPDSPRAIRSLDPQRVRAIWAEVQTAYDADNFERLLSLAAWLETVAEANADTDPSQIIPLSLAERFERLRALARSARTLERRLAHLESDPAWEFPSRRERDRRRLRSDAARALDEELLGVAEALAGVEDFFESIGSPRPPRGTGRR